MGVGGEGRGFRPATPNKRLVWCSPKKKEKNCCIVLADGLLTGRRDEHRGQYSDATLNELESQNDGQVEGILGKVRILKDVRFGPESPNTFAIDPRTDLVPFTTQQMTVAMGDEIRESSALAEKMNDNFEMARHKLKGTMNRMLLMAERTGVGWKVWLGFFAAVCLLFIYVWLF